MGYYKIKNITNNLAKRHAKLNTSQVVDLSTGINAQSITIAPDQEILLESNFLPVSLHKLRTEGLMTIVEIDKNTYQKFLNEQTAKNSQQVADSKAVEEIQEPKKVAPKVFVKKEQKV